jgi:hypothetical protein
VLVAVVDIGRSAQLTALTMIKAEYITRHELRVRIIALPMFLMISDMVNVEWTRTLSSLNSLHRIAPITITPEASPLKLRHLGGPSVELDTWEMATGSSRFLRNVRLHIRRLISGHPNNI